MHAAVKVQRHARARNGKREKKRLAASISDKASAPSGPAVQAGRSVGAISVCAASIQARGMTQVRAEICRDCATPAIDYLIGCLLARAFLMRGSGSRCTAESRLRDSTSWLVRAQKRRHALEATSQASIQPSRIATSVSSMDCE